MEFAIIITASPQASSAEKSAYEFCCAAVDAGHKLNTIFLMHDALQLAVNKSVLSKRWQDFCQKHELTIRTCVTAMERRNIEKKHLLDYFVADGLASVTNDSIASDRVITFR